MRRWSIATLFVFVTSPLAGDSYVVPPSQQFGPVIQYNSSDDNVVVAMEFSSVRQGPWVGPPFLQLFGDGLLVVTEPVGSIENGTYELQLSRKQMTRLLAQLDIFRIMKFNRDEVVKLIEASDAQRTGYQSKSQEITESTDASSVKISVNLDLYRSENSGPVTSNFYSEAQWTDVDEYIKRYPKVVELRLFKEVCQLLQNYAALAKEYPRGKIYPAIDAEKEDSSSH